MVTSLGPKTAELRGVPCQNEIHVIVEPFSFWRSILVMFPYHMSSWATISSQKNVVGHHFLQYSEARVNIVPTFWFQKIVAIHSRSALTLATVTATPQTKSRVHLVPTMPFEQFILRSIAVCIPSPVAACPADDHRADRSSPFPQLTFTPIKRFGISEHSLDEPFLV